MSGSGNSGYESRRVSMNPDPREALGRILPELRRGSVVLLPADTIYGLSCRWDSQRGRDRIQALKGPGRLSMFVALVSSREMVFQYAESPGAEGLRILDEQWPGPVTVVLRARPQAAPEFCLSSDGTVAFRWPRSPFLQELVRDLGVPLVSTSANRTGEGHATTASGAWDLFGAGIDLYVDGGTLAGPASTLLDLTGDHPHLLRLGGALPGGELPGPPPNGATRK